jgi:DNA-binding NarL/FixJ family response regulator
MPFTVLLVDHHDLLRQGLRSLLSAQGEFVVIGETGEGREAVRLALAQSPDVVLIDAQLRGLDGVQTTALIKRRQPQVRVVVLTETKTNDCLRESLQVGADGFVLKEAGFDELLKALRSVVQGRKYLSPEVSPLLVEGYLNPDLPSDGEPDRLRRLTLRERSILQLVAEGRTNRAAAEFLCLSPKTVEKHRASLMRKLCLRNAAELMLAAIEMGLIERPAFPSQRRPPVAFGNHIGAS